MYICTLLPLIYPSPHVNNNSTRKDDQGRQGRIFRVIRVGGIREKIFGLLAAASGAGTDPLESPADRCRSTQDRFRSPSTSVHAYWRLHTKAYLLQMAYLLSNSILANNSILAEHTCQFIHEITEHNKYKRKENRIVGGKLPNNFFHRHTINKFCKLQ